MTSDAIATALREGLKKITVRFTDGDQSFDRLDTGAGQGEK